MGINRDKITMKETKPWYEEWFDENYLDVYRHRNRDEARQQVQLVMETLVPERGASILDLGCGEGRYTILFKNKGFRIIGLDLSETLVVVGKKNYPHLDLVVGDMRYIPGRFDIILSLFTSFGYFDTDEENAGVIHSIFHSLNDNGVVWLDFLNPYRVEKNLVPLSDVELEDGIHVTEKRYIEEGRIVKDIFFYKGSEGKCYRESVRLFTREQLERMFDKAGLKIIRVFGNYSGHAWSRESERTILVGIKGV